MRRRLIKPLKVVMETTLRHMWKVESDGRRGSLDTLRMTSGLWTLCVDCGLLLFLD